MKNHLFSGEHIAILSDPGQWRLIASGLPEEIAAVSSPNDEPWAERHADAHSHREAVIVLGGDGYHRLNGKTYPVTPGTVMLFDTMEEHQLGYPPTHPRGQQLWFLFLPDLVHVSLVSIVGEEHRTGYRLAWQQLYPLGALGLTCTRVLFPDPDTKAPPAAVRRRCLTTLGMLVSAVVEKGYRPQAELPRDESRSRIIRSILRHIQETHGRNCSLENLAALAGYSPYHFSRSFAKHTGMSFSECVNAARTDGFQRMLGEGKPLKKISAELGFSHPSALSRWRRRQGA